MTRTAERVFSALSVVVFSAAGGVIAFDYGREYERARVRRDLWETPPGCASAVVYQDGGKRCVVPTATPAPVSRAECITACKARARMESVR